MNIDQLDAMFDSRFDPPLDSTRKLKTFTAEEIHKAAFRAYAKNRAERGPDVDYLVTVALGIATVMTELGLANEEAFYVKEPTNVGNRKRTRKN